MFLLPAAKAHTTPSTPIPFESSKPEHALTDYTFSISNLFLASTLEAASGWVPLPLSSLSCHARSDVSPAPLLRRGSWRSWVNSWRKWRAALPWAGLLRACGCPQVYEYGYDHLLNLPFCGLEGADHFMHHVITQFPRTCCSPNI